MTRRMLVIVPLFAFAACGAPPVATPVGPGVNYPVEAKKNLFRHCTKLSWPSGVTTVHRNEPVSFQLTNYCDTAVQIDVDDSQDVLFAAGTRSISVPPGGQSVALPLTVKADAQYKKYKVNLKLDGKSKDPDFEVSP